MHYPLTLFGVKDTSETIIEYIHDSLRPLDLVVTVGDAVKQKNEISGVAGLGFVTSKLGIPLFEADSYPLTDEKAETFFEENTFDLGIVVGWQRLIPGTVLDRFSKGVFGFHGNAGYLPFGRGRSPLNWSILLGDTRFNLNLFRYDELPDSPNVFATRMFQISAYDDIRTAQYKNLLCMKEMIAELIACYEKGEDIPVRTESKDFDSWYEKRTRDDGKIDWHARTRDIYNLIRAVTAPFPGAWCHMSSHTVTVWSARPFDEILDFHAFAPGGIIDVFDNRPVVRTVDGSLLIDRYESDITLQKGMLLS